MNNVELEAWVNSVNAMLNKQTEVIELLTKEHEANNEAFALAHNDLNLQVKELKHRVEVSTELFSHYLQDTPTLLIALGEILQERHGAPAAAANDLTSDPQ